MQKLRILFLLGISLHSYFFLVAQEDELPMSVEEAKACYTWTFPLFYSDPGAASAYFQEIIPIFKKEKMWMYYGYSYTGYCSAENRLGNFQKAEELAEFNVEEVKDRMGKNNEQYIAALSNLSQFYIAKGKYAKGIEALNESVAINEAFTRVDYELISYSYHQLGGAYKELGDLTEAIKYYEKSLQIWLDQNRPPKYRHAMVLCTSIGDAYRDSDQWEKARQTYHNFLPYADEESYIRICYGLGAAYLGQNKIDSARYYIEKGMNISIKDKKPYLHTGLELLGDINLHRRDSVQALQDFQLAQENRLHSPQREYSNKTLIETYRKIGELLYQGREYTKSLEQFQVGISYLQNKEVDSSDWKYTPPSEDIIIPWEAIPILKSKAQSLLALYFQTKNEEFLSQAQENIKLGADLAIHILQLHESDGGKIRLSEAVRPLIELGIEVSKELYQLHNDEAYLWDALRFSETVKSRLLIDELLETKAIFETNLPKETRDRLQELEAEIGFYKSEIDGLSLSSKKDSLKVDRWQSTLFSLESELQALTRKLEDTYPLFRKSKIEFPQVDKNSIQKILGPEGILLEFFWGEKQLYLFSVKKGAIQLSTFPQLEDLNRQIDTLANKLRSPDMSKEAYDQFVSSSRNLYQQLLAPVLDKNSPGNLYLVPDGLLAYIPFDILLTTEVDSLHKNIQTLIPSQIYRRLPYLFQKYNIQYLHAASLIPWQTSLSKKAGKRIATFAPNYQGLAQLKLNKSSAQEIGKILGGNIYLDQDATENNFKTKANNYETLHLAVHGNADVLSPINAFLDFGKLEKMEDDNRLYAYELYALSLNTKLVSLIACEAGYGKLEGGEGVMSLARAFRMAGANSIMTSLWKADGRAAAPISKRFYENLQEGMRPSESLKLAKTEFLKAADPAMTHPYFWATYVIMGNDDVIWQPFLKSYGLWIAGLLLILSGIGLFRLNNLRGK